MYLIVEVERHLRGIPFGSAWIRGLLRVKVQHRAVPIEQLIGDIFGNRAVHITNA